MKTYITPKVKVFAIVSHHIMSGSDTITVQNEGTLQSKEDDDFDFGC